MPPSSTARRRVIAGNATVRHPGTQVDLHSFTKALVAGLIGLNVDAVYPHDIRDRRGFAGVVRVLDLEVKRLRKKGASQDIVFSLSKIANELRPGNTGSYGGFEAALRSLQLTFTSSPNPFYDDIAFPVSKMQARSFTETIPDFQKKLALAAAKAFVAARKRENT
jgi:hypothetical protein